MTREIIDINSVSKVWQSLISERFFPKSRMNIVTKQIKYKISKKTDVSMSSWPSSLWITKSLLAKTYLNFENVGPNFSNLTPIIFYPFLKINGKKVDETQSGYELKVRELFESTFRVIMIYFFLAL